MAKDQLDLQFEIPVEIPNGGEPQINGQQIKEQQTKQEPPLTLLLHQAKLRMIVDFQKQLISQKKEGEKRD